MNLTIKFDSYDHKNKKINSVYHIVCIVNLNSTLKCREIAAFFWSLAQGKLHFLVDSLLTKQKASLEQHCTGAFARVHSSFICLFLNKVMFEVRKSNFSYTLCRETMDFYCLEVKNLAMILLNQLAWSLQIDSEEMKGLFCNGYNQCGWISILHVHSQTWQLASLHTQTQRPCNNSISVKWNRGPPD